MVSKGDIVKFPFSDLSQVKGHPDHNQPVSQ
jgi:hypothetical protein